MQNKPEKYPYEKLYETGKRAQPSRESKTVLIALIVLTVIAVAVAVIVPMLLKDNA